ncbi:GYF_domain-containing protein [Hexamita inflata]|uniref:GYF domain-containing protein n=1 Tax=Hexamita inflata TaxID=28002 RepID=A0AA86N6M5_9EUKA|nr:GYF domain-containing protein [Hexamita inflata]
MYTIEQIRKCFVTMDSIPIDVAMLKMTNNQLPIRDTPIRPLFMDSLLDVSSVLKEDEKKPARQSRPGQRVVPTSTTPRNNNSKDTHSARDTPARNNNSQNNNKNQQQYQQQNEQPVDPESWKKMWELPTETDDLSKILNQDVLDDIRGIEKQVDDITSFITIDPPKPAAAILDIINFDILDPTMTKKSAPVQYMPVAQSQSQQPQQQRPVAQRSFQWQYIDLKGVVRGPFDQQLMAGWYSKRQLPEDLKIKLFGTDQDFNPLNMRWAGQPAFQGFPPQGRW